MGRTLWIQKPDKRSLGIFEQNVYTIIHLFTFNTRNSDSLCVIFLKYGYSSMYISHLSVNPSPMQKIGVTNVLSWASIH